jgi:hypothetical protein
VRSWNCLQIGAEILVVLLFNLPALRIIIPFLASLSAPAAPPEGDALPLNTCAALPIYRFGLAARRIDKWEVLLYCHRHGCLEQ